jgi:hypothetical protein
MDCTTIADKVNIVLDFFFYKNVLFWDRKCYLKDYRVKRKKLYIILKNKMKEMEEING